MGIRGYGGDNRHWERQMDAIANRALRRDSIECQLYGQPLSWFAEIWGKDKVREIKKIVRNEHEKRT